MGNDPIKTTGPYAHLLPITSQEALELLGILRKDPGATSHRENGHIFCGDYQFANGPQGEPELDQTLT